MFFILLIMFLAIALGIFIASFQDWTRGECGTGWPLISGLIILASVIWGGYALTLKTEYEDKIYTGQIINSISEDNHVISTAIYSENGEVKIKELKGYVPAGVEIEVRNAKRWYAGLYFEKLEPKIEIKFPETGFQLPENKEGVL